MSSNLSKQSKNQRSLGSSLKSQGLFRDSLDINSNIQLNDLLNTEFSGSQEEIKALTDYVRKLEAEIREKEIFYNKTVNDLSSKIQAKAEENVELKEEIYEIKNEAKQLKKESQNLLNEHLQCNSIHKSVSAKNLPESSRNESIFDDGKQDRYKLKGSRQMF